jgi:hypothetical protein
VSPFLLLLACASGDPDQDSGPTAQDGGSMDGGGAVDGGGSDGGGSDGGGSDGGGSDGGTEPLFEDLASRRDYFVGSLVYARWDQLRPATVHVEYSFDEGTWLSTPAVDRDQGSQEQVLLGVPFGASVQWRLVGDGQVLDAGSPIQAGEHPHDLPLATVDVALSDAWLPGADYLLTSVNQEPGGWTRGTWWTVILDRQGRAVWALQTPDERWTMYAQVARSGDHLLWDANTYWSEWDDGAASRVFRRTLDQEWDNLATPGLHHAFVQLPDGSLAWGSQDHGGGEALVTRGFDDTEETVLWTCAADWPGAGDCASNGLYYHDPTDRFLFSFYSNDSLVEIDRATGDSLWWAGEVEGGYAFAEGSQPFTWQHGVSWTEAGTLLLSSHVVVDGVDDTWAIEYQVDHGTRLLTQVWSYSPGVYARTNGDTWRLDNGNTLHTLGSAGHVFEVDPAGQPVWHLTYADQHMMGRSEWIPDLYALVGATAPE